MSTSTIAVSLSSYSDITGSPFQLEDLVTKMPKDRKVTKVVTLESYLTFSSTLSEAIYIQPVLFLSVVIMLLFSLIDVMLFMTRNNFLLHPYLDLGIFIGGVGLVNTFLTGGRAILESKTSNV